MVEEKSLNGDNSEEEQQTLEKFSLKNKVKDLTSKILSKLPLKDK